jgi:aspartate carbamoyltransferase catalytic subunit
MSKNINHILSAKQFDRETLENLFLSAEDLRHERNDLLKGKILSTLFYHPSTRTRLSFESAMLRLGGSVISTENAKETSSASKGEDIEDTIRTVSTYADAIVIRDTEDDTATRAASVSSVPIINAGDGGNEHPTQAILDLYTIKQELGRIDDIKIAMVGDLKNGRALRSLSLLLALFKNISIVFISPPELAMKPDIKTYLDDRGVSYKETDDFEGNISDVDIVYMTRIPEKYLGEESRISGIKEKYIFTESHLGMISKEAIVIHLLPRIDSISKDVDSSPKAAYFRQAGYGVEVRMALLKWLFA